MKDSRIDLCGERGHGQEPVSFLERDARFSFACRGCGGCCRGREDIVLSGHDLYRIAGRLRLPPRTVVRGFCRHSVGPDSRLPVVRLAPLRAERNNCPFLFQNHCTIHDAAPLVCALYPLGQQIGPDGAVRYFVQDTGCGGAVVEARLEDFLARYGIAEREAVAVRWAESCIRLSGQVRRLEPVLEPVLWRRLQDKLLDALYYDYDYAGAYLPQLDANLARFAQEAARLEEWQLRRRTIEKNDG